MYEFDKKKRNAETINEDDKKLTFKKDDKSIIIYDASICKHRDIKEVGNFSLKSKYSFLPSLCDDLDKFIRPKTTKYKTKQKKKKQTFVTQLQNYIMTG